jgi:hypothetical protein
MEEPTPVPTPRQATRRGQPTIAPERPVDLQRTTAVRASAAPQPTAPASDPWPALLPATEEEPLDDTAAVLRQWERLQRLDREQRGVTWSASPF